MKCVCGHQPWLHGQVTYPAHRRPCDVCINCGQTKRNCCLTPKPCVCADFRAEETADA